MSSGHVEVVAGIGSPVCGFIPSDIPGSQDIRRSTLRYSQSEIEGTDMSNAGPGLPFSRPIVRRIVEELFQVQQMWKNADLTRRVVEIHKQRGGLLQTAPGPTLNRALQDLKTDGFVSNPGHGYWKWDGNSSAAPTEETVDDTESILLEPIDDIQDGLEPVVRIEREIGNGPEHVYLYFNPNDRLLAELQGRDVWECKIGRTSGADAVSRIMSQGTRTALSRVPSIGLVIHTEDSMTLEKALHASLRMVEAEVPGSPGIEWFVTSPEKIEAWYASFLQTIEHLRSINLDSQKSEEHPRE